MPTLVWLDDFRHQTASTATHTGAQGTAIWSANANTGQISFIDNGVEIFMQIDANNLATQVTRPIAGGTVYILSIWVMLTAIPAGNSEVLSIAAAATDKPLRLEFLVADGAWHAEIESTLAEIIGPVVVAGQWYHHEFRLNISANPWSLEWTVNKVSQGSVTKVEAGGSTFSSIRIGTGSTHTFTAQYKHGVGSATSADYPIGPALVKYLVPTTEGTDNIGAGSITTQANATLNMFNVADEWPADATDYIRQTANGATLYAEVLFTGVADPTIWDVSAYLAYTASATQAMSASAILASSAAGLGNVTLIGGDFSDTDTRFSNKFLARPGGGWTAALLNSMKARVGFGIDTSPNPRFISLLLQYAIPFPEHMWGPVYPDRQVDPKPGDAGGRQTTMAYVRTPEAAVVPELSWQPRYPDRIDRRFPEKLPVGNLSEYAYVNPPEQLIKPLTWQGRYPDRVDPRPPQNPESRTTLAYVHGPQQTAPESWKSVYPDRVDPRPPLNPETRTGVAYVPAISRWGLDAIPWLPRYPDFVSRGRSANEWIGSYALVLLPQIFAPLSWDPEYPDWIARAQASIENLTAFAYVPAISAFPPPELSWAPQYPTVVYPKARPGESVSAFVALIAEAPALSWQPHIPTSAVRPTRAGESVLAFVPLIELPPLSWLPHIPTVVYPKMHPREVLRSFVQLVGRAEELSWETKAPTAPVIRPSFGQTHLSLVIQESPTLAWQPVYPSAPVRIERRPDSALAWVLSPAPSGELGWLPMGDGIARRILARPDTPTLVGVLPAPSPELAWQPIYPGAAILIPRRAEGENFLTRVETVAVPELSWRPIYPDDPWRTIPRGDLLRAFEMNISPIAGAAVPPLAWLGIYPDVPITVPREAASLLVDIAWRPSGPIWIDYESILEYDTTKVGTVVSVYFEAVLEVDAGGGPVYARAFNITDGTVLAGSEISFSGAAATRIRSAALTMPTGAKEYRAEIGVPLGSSGTCRAARLIADVG